MKKEQIDFIKRANKFLVLNDGERKEFDTWKDGATYYNEHVRTANKIEIIALMGVIAMTIAYKYGNYGRN